MAPEAAPNAARAGAAARAADDPNAARGFVAVSDAEGACVLAGSFRAKAEPFGVRWRDGTASVGDEARDDLSALKATISARRLVSSARITE